MHSGKTELKQKIFILHNNEISNKNIFWGIIEMRNTTRILSFIIILIFSPLVFAQTQQQIEQFLKSKGVNSESDLKKLLAEENISETQAREIANYYGMNYDEFVSKYFKDVSVKPQKIEVKPIDNSSTNLTTRDSSSKENSGISNTDLSPTSQIKPSPESGDKRYFGYNLFENIPSSFEPAEVGPIDPGYLIGPGDILRLSVWGATEFQYQLEVDAQGNIFIPTAGQVFVSGTSYESLQKKLTIYLSKFYEGLMSDPPTTFLDVSLTKLRPIRIFVTGEVKNPGGYNISSFATVFNALYAVGGPLVSGSLREIKVIRNNKVITTVDLYDYLLKGQLINDVRLQNNDMVFIPPRKKSVSINGEVFRPAIYELKDSENLQKLIEYCGGLKSSAYIKRIQIKRVRPFNLRTDDPYDIEYVDIDLSKVLSKEFDYELYNDDEITVFPIIDKEINFVSIEGSVYFPGKYDIKTNKTLTQLIKKAGGLLPETYYGKADIIRTNLDESKIFISIDLYELMSNPTEKDLELQPRDNIKIYSIYDLVDKKNVSISGYVKNPITLPYADSLTLYDLVFRAGGLQDPFFRGRAFLQRADLIRFNPDGVTTRIIPFNLEDVLKDRSFDMKLEPGDRVLVYKADVEKVLDKFVTIEGEVRAPGKYSLSTGMTPMDLILQAGGFTEEALRTEVYVNRVSESGYPGNKISESFKVELPLMFDRENKNNQKFVLKHKDIVVVRKNPEFESQRVVRIDGEVMFPGVYALEKKSETFYELLKKAGGPTEEAFLFGTQFNRDNHRLVVNAEELWNDYDEDLDVILKNGDIISIPKKPNSILVTGEVNNPGLYKYTPGLSVKDYIDFAGGETDSSNYILYTKANGETKKVGFGFFSSNPTVYDGSVINVIKKAPEPPSETTFDVGGTIKDVLSVIVSAVTIIVLAKQL